jgi:hypothetical protein
MMRWTLLFMLLLCSCATQRQAEKYFDKHPEELAAYVDRNDEYTEVYGEKYSIKHFPPRLYAPAFYIATPVIPQRLSTLPVLDHRPLKVNTPWQFTSAACDSVFTVRTVFKEDTARLDALLEELNREREDHGKIKEKLVLTEKERDYWQEMNQKKFWTLIAMVFFALMYILFKIMASRIRPT